MKKMFLIVFLISSITVHAGGMISIPLQLLPIENQGRIEFMKNALNDIGLREENVKYSNFKTIVVGGDEKGSDYKSGLFIYEAQLESESGESYKCYQYLSVGNFDPNLTRQIVCQPV